MLNFLQSVTSHCKVTSGQPTAYRRISSLFLCKPAQKSHNIIKLCQEEHDASFWLSKLKVLW